MQLNLEQVQDMLPELVRDMAQRIGLPATLTVVEKLGGTIWYVADGHGPAGQARRDALAELVGKDIEQQLHQHYAGTELSLPRCAAALRRIRDLGINQRFEQAVAGGASVRAAANDIARKEKLTSRWVQKVVYRGVPAPAAQGDLFG